MDIFRFWSSFDVTAAVTPALASLVEVKTPEQLVSCAPTVLMRDRPIGAGGHSAGIVLGFVLREDQRDLWRAPSRIGDLSAPLTVPGLNPSRAVFFSDGPAHTLLQDWMISRLNEATRAFAEEAAEANLTVGRLRMKLEGYERLLLDEEIEPPAVSLRQTIHASSKFHKLDGEAVLLTIDPSIKAIHAIDLLLELDEPPVGDRIQAELVGLETGTMIATWTLTAATSGAGWRQFWVPPSTVASREICQMRIRADPPAGRWSVALGQMDKRGFFSAGLPSDAQPIACRVWERSIAWDTPPSLGAVMPAGVPAPSRRVGRIRFSAHDLMAQAIAVDSAQRNRLQWRDDLSAFQLHPDGRKAVVACLKGITVADVERISADVMLAHPQAVDTDFALWAAPSESPHDAGPSEPRQQSRWKLVTRLAEPLPDTAGTRWLSLSGGERGVLNVRLQGRFSGELDIFIATRNRAERSDFAWALFKSLIIQ